MKAVFLALAVLIFGLAKPLFSQTADEVEAARELHIAGEFQAALSVLMPAAEAGNPVAQNVVGVSYEDGMGVERDVEKAIEWYRAAADQGFGKAMHNLGVIYQHEKYGRTDQLEKARALFESAIAAGYDGSYSNLALMLTDGLGGDVDVERALELYRICMPKDDKHCTNNLAHFYREGTGVEQDHAKARQLYGKAALLGLSDGYNNLGVMNELGMGGPSNTAVAAALYRSAIRRGNTNGANNLTTMILDGKLPGGQRQDALAYCLWSEQQGGLAKGECDSVAEGLSEEAITQAQTRAGEF